MSQPQVLFPIAVEPQALSDHPTDRDRLIHREVVRTLGDHGILILPAADQKALLEAIQGLDDLSKTLWDKQIRSLIDLNRLDLRLNTIGVSERLRHDGGPTEGKPTVRVFVASRESAKLYGVDDASGFKTVNDSDVVLASAVDRSPALNAAKKVGLFPMGKARRSEVADSLIRPLAVRSSAVKLLDPHILEGVINSKKTAHAEWIIRALATTMPAHSTLSMLGKLQGYWQPTDRAGDESVIEDFLTRALQGRRLPMTVNVRLLKSIDLRNRYIWFSSGHSFDVLHNFTALSEEVLDDELRFVRHSDELAQQTLRIAEKMENNTQSTMVSVTKVIP